MRFLRPRAAASRVSVRRGIWWSIIHRSQGLDKNLAHQARVLGAMAESAIERKVAEARASAARVYRRAVREADSLRRHVQRSEAPPPPIGLISRLSVSGCRESAGPLAAFYSSEFWMSGLVASFRSGDVLRPSRRSGGVLRPSRRSGDVLRPSCTVAERDGPPKGKSPVLPLPEQAASKVPKNTKATTPTKRCNMTRDAPSGAVP
jgi:hypothetical protein